MARKRKHRLDLENPTKVKEQSLDVGRMYIETGRAVEIVYKDGKEVRRPYVKRDYLI